MVHRRSPRGAREEVVDRAIDGGREMEEMSRGISGVGAKEAYNCSGIDNNCPSWLLSRRCNDEMLGGVHRVAREEAFVPGDDAFGGVLFSADNEARKPADESDQVSWPCRFLSDVD